MSEQNNPPQIPGYRIEALIAEGGMARVYRAIQESLQRPVALKVLTPGQDPSFSQRFLQEGRTIAALRHPGIIGIHDIGVAGQVHFISMELIEGGDLDARIGRGISPQHALGIVRALAETLAFVHAQGVVHRDIKPANILFRADDRPLLSDFGIAKQLRQDLKLTQADLALGSPYYLSPEQAQGKKIDGRSDIYSLGIVFFEMLTGKLPFRGKEAMDTILLHLNEPLPTLKKSLRAFQPVLEKMTAKVVKNRYPDCTELLKALDALQASGADALPKGDGCVATPRSKRHDNRTRAARHALPPAQLPGASLRPWLLALVLLGSFLLIDGPSRLLQWSGMVASEVSAPPRIHWQQDDAGRLAQWLKAGHDALAEDRLSLPSEHNARYYFEQALRIDPANPDAGAGLVAIGERYWLMARQALQQGETVKASVYVKRGLQVQPDHRELLRLHARLAPNG